MRALRVVVAVLLCLALPLQGAAALRIAATPCPAGHGDATATHAGHAPTAYEDCQPMPCCEDQQNSPLSGAGCDSCATCMLGTAFVSVESTADAPCHPEALGPQRRTPGFDPLALVAIWRPPTTC